MSGRVHTLRGAICRVRVPEDEYVVAVLDRDTHTVEVLAEWAKKRLRSDYPKRISVRYWIASAPMSDEAIRDGAIRAMLGDPTINYNIDYGPFYREPTGYLWNDEEFRVGGHDLIAELRQALGGYVLLEVVDHSEVK